MGRKAKELGPLAILNARHQEDRNALVFASPRGGMLSGISLDRRAASDESTTPYRMAFAPASGTGAPNARTIPAKSPK